MSCPISCTPLRQVLDDRVIPRDGKIPCLGKTLKGQYCRAPISRDRQAQALDLLECCIYCSRLGCVPLNHAIKNLAVLLVHQQHSGEQDAVYVRWRSMVKEFKNKREKPLRENHQVHLRKLDRPQEYDSDILVKFVAPEPVKTRKHTHVVNCSESDQTSCPRYPMPTDIQQHQTINDDEPAQLTVIHSTLPNPKCLTETRKSVSIQTEADEVYTPITLWSCFFGLIFQCGVMICSLLKVQFGPTQFCDRAGNVKMGSMVHLKLELGIRWSLTDLVPRWVVFTVISFLPLRILLGPWLGLLCICWIGVQLQESPIRLDLDVYRLV
ncbi:hypothetical protein PITC_000010 [Penicillium italicum]|uniref:Uncharacterized protein n=1 Tax=Penicillium italicum TaxID=40296 RepID=A0A0A2KRM3_PENIT|nr:hypothetical protein PITC_000010 [Penicillium italicum]